MTSPHDAQPNQADPPAPIQPAQARSNQPIPWWRLGLPLLLQSLLILAVPAQDVFTYTTGHRVVLQTAPVDPYDILRGYYQTLGYEVSSIDTLESLPGGDLFANRDFVGPIYVVLEEPTATTTPPTPWQPVRVSRDRPTALADHQIALRGRAESWRILYGLETYYMPEDQRDTINQAIATLQSQQPQAFVVEVRIDGWGHAVPVSLWVGETNYRF
ncbi:MAG: GDYXXLXY domain-containing protein [Leptolyngbya sp.]|nr:GDYXXLXY domain-containing protein [Leptolyngbya sp.]